MVDEQRAIGEFLDEKTQKEKRHNYMKNKRTVLREFRIREEQRDF